MTTALSPEEREQIRARIEKSISKTEKLIAEYTELTKPISPENAIGRISRMDAINNKSVNEAALRNAKNKLQRIKRSLNELDSEAFGLCRQCGERIEFKKLLVMPESVRCVSCVKGDR
ncbi:MAG: TraR/DksA C4-type zinc finger protein [Bacteroidia bacterium]|nr:TraR/DksA C4-type zinc finger protein [Bacteroidia bacterium]